MAARKKPTRIIIPRKENPDRDPYRVIVEFYATTEIEVEAFSIDDIYLYDFEEHVQSKLGCGIDITTGVTVNGVY